MRTKVLNDTPERTIALVFDRDDEVISLLTQLAVDHGLSASRFTAIGAPSSVPRSATSTGSKWTTSAYP